jgi:hypothetical protein
MTLLRKMVSSLARDGRREGRARMVARLRSATRPLDLLGVHPLTLVRTVTGMPRFVADARAYARLSTGDEGFPIDVRHLYPILEGRHEQAGMAGTDYFHQDLWAARKIFERAPAEHFDIGSRVDGFVAHVLTFMPVTVIDIRPLTEPVEGLRFIQEDATHLKGFADASLESVSSLHAIEHFGLGRYGDPIDPLGARKAMAALVRVLRPGGRLYFSVPIGRQRLEFNAHRVFSPAGVLDALSPLTLVSFAAVDDAGHLRLDVEPSDFEHAEESCGLFEFGRE